MVWILCSPCILFAGNLQHSHKSGERQGMLVGPTQLSTIKPQHVWPPHSSYAPVQELCHTCIIALVKFPSCVFHSFFFLIVWYVSYFQGFKNFFLMNCLCFLPALGIFELSHLLTVMRLLFFKLVRGVVWEPFTIVKLNRLQCLARGSFVLFKNPLAEETCLSVSDGGDTVIDRTKNSLVASCFPPKQHIYYFIGVD